MCGPLRGWPLDASFGLPPRRHPLLMGAGSVPAVCSRSDSAIALAGITRITHLLADLFAAVVPADVPGRVLVGRYQPRVRHSAMAGRSAPRVVSAPCPGWTWASSGNDANTLVVTSVKS